MAEAGPSTTPMKALEVVYCNSERKRAVTPESMADIGGIPQVCSYPPEYCSYGSRLSKCKKWLSKSHPDLFTKYYGDEPTSGKDAADEDGEGEDAAVKTAKNKLQGMTLDEEKEAAKKEAKAERKERREEEKRLSSKILIKRVERTKRKMTTSIQGLEAFGIDLKKSSKLFANKFATGASVSKNAAGEDEIVIQGDVAYEVEEMLLKSTGKEGELFAGKIPNDGNNIEISNVKTKKKAEE